MGVDVVVAAADAAVVVGADVVAVAAAGVAEAVQLSVGVELAAGRQQPQPLLQHWQIADFGRWSWLQQRLSQPNEHGTRPPSDYGSVPLRHCGQSGTGVRMDRIRRCGTYGTARSCTLDDAGDCAVPACRARTGTCRRTYTHPLPRMVGTARFCISRY